MPPLLPLLGARPLPLLQLQQLLLGSNSIGAISNVLCHVQMIPGMYAPRVMLEFFHSLRPGIINAEERVVIEVYAHFRPCCKALLTCYEPGHVNI